MFIFFRLCNPEKACALCPLLITKIFCKPSYLRYPTFHHGRSFHVCTKGYDCRPVAGNLEPCGYNAGGMRDTSGHVIRIHHRIHLLGTGSPCRLKSLPNRKFRGCHIGPVQGIILIPILIFYYERSVARFHYSKAFSEADGSMADGEGKKFFLFVRNADVNAGRLLYRLPVMRCFPRFSTTAQPDPN